MTLPNSTSGVATVADRPPVLDDRWLFGHPRALGAAAGAEDGSGMRVGLRGRASLAEGGRRPHSSRDGCWGRLSSPSASTVATANTSSSGTTLRSTSASPLAYRAARSQVTPSARRR